MVAAALLPLAPVASAAQSDDAPSIERLWGQDRYETSLEVARRFVQEAGGSIDAVVLVSGTSWPDAVIAAGLAGSLDAPVLLIQADGLTDDASSFLTEAGVSEVVVVGASDVVSQQAIDGLAAFGSVQRISGADASAASVAVAERIGTPGTMPGDGTTAIVASSEVFVDAMVAGGFAARGAHPVLLTSRDELDGGVSGFVTGSGVEHVVIMGGSAAVSTSVEDELEGLGVDVTRLGGETRFHTAQVVAEFIEGKYQASGDKCFDRSTAGLATARVPFDSFGAGPLLGLLCAPLLLTEVQHMDSGTAEWLRAETDTVVVFGGTAAVSEAALAGLRPEPVPEPELPTELTDPDRSTLEGILAEAAARRAVAIADLTANINSGKYGIDDNNVLRGPAGFRVNLDDCDDDWSNTTGVTSTEIRIGHTIAQSGNLAFYGNIAIGWENYLNWVNENDPVIVDGSSRDLQLVVKDDGYSAIRTIELVDELIEDGNVLSITTAGAPSALATYNTLNDACVPHPFALLAGHPAFGDPVNHPWTTGSQLSYTSEAILWGEWIKRNLSDKLPVKVGALVMNNDFGKPFESSFKQWAEANPDVVSEFLAARHDPGRQGVRPEMETIENFGPDVYISMTAGSACLDAIRDARDTGLIGDIRRRDGALFTMSYCSAVGTYMRPAGSAADGWWIIGDGWKDSTDPNHTDEPFIEFINTRLESAGLDTTNTLYAWGYRYGYPYVEAVRIAAALPGGLTRTNLLLAIRSLEIYHPLLFDGIRARFNGNSDAFFVEGSHFNRYDASKHAWKKTGGIINANSKTPNCSWNLDVGRCE